MQMMSKIPKFEANEKFSDLSSIVLSCAIDKTMDEEYMKSPSIPKNALEVKECANKHAKGRQLNPELIDRLLYDLMIITGISLQILQDMNIEKHKPIDNISKFSGEVAERVTKFFVVLIEKTVK